MDTLIFSLLSCQNCLEKWGWLYQNISPISMQVPALNGFQEKSANFYQFFPLHKVPNGYVNFFLAFMSKLFGKMSMALS
jgi:hypothetical protein